MLKVRIIPTLLVSGHGLVKGTQFDSWRRVGPVMPTVRVYDLRDVDELILLDIRASSESRSIEPQLVEQVALETSVPLSAGGGIGSLKQARTLFDAGADRVVLNTCVYKDPQLITEIANVYGSQSVVVAIDARRISSRWECFSNSGRVPRQILPSNWAREAVERGAGEILLTSVEHEGLMQGVALDLTREVADALQAPVIASGGVGSVQDAADAVLQGGAAAVSCSSIFHFTSITPVQVKKELAAAGIPVRGSDL